MAKSSCKKDREYYGTCAVTRAHFKKICLNNEWGFTNFEETFSGEKTGRVKKFFYKYNGTEIEVNVKSKNIIEKLMITYKLRIYDLKQLKTEEASFYARGLKISLEDVSQAICDICFA